MRLSASSINTFTKCGYAYKLRYLDRLDTGKRGYKMLHGKIAEEIVCQARRYPDKSVGEIAGMVYAYMYEEAGIPSELADRVIALVSSDVVSSDAMLEVDEYSDLINESPGYTFKAPAPLKRMKRDSYSTDAKRLPVMILQALYGKDGDGGCARMIELLRPLWNKAAEVEDQVGFEFTLSGDLKMTGFYDQLLTMPDGSRVVIELKMVSTPYSASYLVNDNQCAVYYKSLLEKADTPVRVIVGDIGQSCLVEYDPSKAGDIMEHAKQIGKAIEAEAFFPVCTTSPYAASSSFCEFKCNGCPYNS